MSQFSEREIAPLLEAADEGESLPRELFRKWVELGLLGVRYPEEEGGFEPVP